MEIEWLSSLIVPLIGVSRKFLQCRNVIFPELLCPRIEITFPLEAEREIPFKTASEPKFLCRSITSSIQTPPKQHGN